jgi:hypothetical protein
MHLAIDLDGLRHNADSFYCASSGSKARKAASAAIAKIPFVLAQHVARSWKPANFIEQEVEAAA